MAIRQKLIDRITAGQSRGEDVSPFEEALANMPPAQPEGPAQGTPKKARKQPKEPKAKAPKQSAEETVFAQDTPE